MIATSAETDQDTQDDKPVEAALPKRQRDSVVTPAGLQEDPDIHASTLRLWGVLSLYADDSGSITIPLNAIARLAATFLSQRQALVQMQTMERQGLVDVERGVSRKTPNTYTLRTSRRKAAVAK